MAAILRPRFYQAIALALGLLVLVGFARTFYLRQWFAVPPITMLLQLHGIVFTAWFVLFVIQTRLIAANKVRTHRQLGIAGIVVAALVFALGLATAIESASAPRMRPMGMNSQQFVFVPLFAITLFAALVAAAVVYRRRADVHRRLMMLAMIAVLGPPVARLIMLFDIGKHFLLVQTLVPAVFVAGCLLNDRVKHRVVHPIYAIGGALLVLSWPARVAIAHTSAWEHAGQWLASL